MCTLLRDGLRAYIRGSELVEGVMLQAVIQAPVWLIALATPISAATN